MTHPDKPSPIRVAQGRYAIRARFHGANSPEAIAARRALIRAKMDAVRAELDRLQAQLDEMGAAS